MKRQLLALVLVMILCVTSVPAVASSTTVENSLVSVGETSVVITANKDLYVWGGGSGSTTPKKVLSNVEFASTYGRLAHDGIFVAITTSKDLYVWGFNYHGQVGNGQGGGGLLNHLNGANQKYNHIDEPFKVLSNVVSVNSDGESVFAITTNGDLYTWGRNNYGQLGNGKGGEGGRTGQDEYQNAPVKVLSNIASVAMGKGANKGIVLAVATNGDLYSWGRNDYGQVGNGKSGADVVQKTPVKILSDVASLPSNGGYGAAITMNGDLYTWGISWFGQVGNGKSGGVDAIQTTPVKVLSDVVSVLTGGTTFAIKSNGDLYGWGYTEQGQVGNGKQRAEDSQATPVKILSNVLSVTSLYTNTSAITTNGDLYVWGSGGHFLNGNDSFEHQDTPFKVLSNVVYFKGNSDINSVAITKNGDLYTWGNNEHGQIGNGDGGKGSDPLSWGIKQKVPVKVLSNVVSASIIDSVSSALTKNGDLYTWGQNKFGSVGNGERSEFGEDIFQKTPVKILSNVIVSNVAAPTPEIKAVPTSSKVLVDGKSVEFDAYTISGNNYFKLRDLAFVLNTSGKKFSVAWDGKNNAIALESGESYTAVGGEMATKGTSTVNAVTSTSVIMLNGNIVKLTAYTINNNNFFKLRDVGEAFDFNVSWDGVLKTIVIDTTSSYTAD